MYLQPLVFSIFKACLVYASSKGEGRGVIVLKCLSKYLPLRGRDIGIHSPIYNLRVCGKELSTYKQEGEGHSPVDNLGVCGKELSSKTRDIGALTS